MRRLPMFVICLALSSAALAADSNRIIKLEQDVRSLERQLSVLQREVRELRRHMRDGARLDAGAALADPPATSDAWLSAGKWQAVRIGASELEVIELLGQPTSMRDENGARMLLYAMEIGAAGFLSGSITLRDRKVAEISTPVLK